MTAVSLLQVLDVRRGRKAVPGIENAPCRIDNLFPVKRVVIGHNYDQVSLGYTLSSQIDPSDASWQPELTE